MQLNSLKIGKTNNVKEIKKNLNDFLCLIISLKLCKRLRELHEFSQNRHHLT